MNFFKEISYLRLFALNFGPNAWFLLDFPSFVISLQTYKGVLTHTRLRWLYGVSIRTRWTLRYVVWFTKMVHISLINKENMPRNVSGRLTSRLLCEQYATRGKIIWKTQHVQLLWRVSRSIFERNVTTQLCWGRW